MADPLSLTASIIAIGGAAVAALKISIALCDIARNVNEAADDIENFSLDVRSFALVVQLGHDSLERHQRRSPLSHVLQYIESNNVIEQLAKQSERTKDRLEKAWKSTDSLEGGVKLVNKFRWMLKKEEIRGLKPEMESLKTSLQVVMSSIMMEFLQQKEDSEDIREEINSLKSQIQVHLETIKVLQNIAQKHQAQAKSSSDAEGSPVFELPLEQDAQIALLGLGTSMVKNERVPDEVDIKQNEANSRIGNLDTHHAEGPSASEILPYFPSEDEVDESLYYHFNPRAACYTLSGFMSITSSDLNGFHWMWQEALSSSTISANFVSTAVVNSFGIPAPPIIKINENIWINFEHEKCRVIGKIFVFWRSSLKKSSTIVRYDYLVYESSQERILLNKWKGKRLPI